jgi:hypothetical protein
MSVLKDGLDYLNANPGQVTLLAALLAVALQYAVNKIKDLGELTNYTLALMTILDSHNPYDTLYTP